jgi:RNA recognition motif-containing protein
VGNLPYDWNEDQLRVPFAALGTVTNAAIARYRGRGRSRGFGFIEMATEEEAQTAIVQLHDSPAGSRKMVVRLSKASESRPDEVAAAGHRSPAPRSAAPRTPAPRRERPRGRFGNRHERPDRPSRPRREIGIVNNSGYEFLPRGAARPEEPSADNRPAERQIEPSPYFDDTGDYENRGRSRRRPGDR